MRSGMPGPIERNHAERSEAAQRWAIVESVEAFLTTTSPLDQIEIH